LSYVRSDAGGDLNEFNTYFGNQKHPVLRPDEYGMQPYDVPNRLLFWGEFAGRAVRDVLQQRRSQRAIEV
jgi:hypothetical protein